MAKMSDKEFDHQYTEATRRGNETLKTEPRARKVRYDRKTGRIIVELLNGCTFIFPPTLAQGLNNATPGELAEIELTPFGLGLHWPKLDADFTITGLMAGIFGTKAWMSELGRKGGHATSDAKAAASKENGKKGGRPRKKSVNLEHALKHGKDKVTSDRRTEGKLTRADEMLYDVWDKIYEENKRKKQ